MAFQDNSGKGKVVHRQTFQNSNCVTELTVKTYPKPTRPSFPTPEPFFRECKPQKKIERIEKENKNVKNAATKKAAGAQVVDKSDKGVGGSVTIEVTRKRSKKTRHPHIPDGGTWKDVLSQYSSVSDHSRSSSGSEMMEAVMLSPRQHPGPNQPSHQQHPQSAAQSSPFIQSSKYPSQMHLHPQPSDAVIHHPHHPCHLSIHQPKNAHHLTAQEQASQHALHSLTCPPQHTVPSTVQEHPSVPVTTHPSPHNPAQQPMSQSPMHHPESRFHPVAHISQHAPQPPTNNVPTANPRHHTSHHTVLSAELPNNPLAPQQHEYSHLPQSTDPTKAPARGHLQSDNASTSPFGDSALQILHRLRMQLQTKGENECTDMVDAVEAIINGKGSMGGVGSRNPQLLPTPNLHHHFVFPTPEPSFREPRPVEDALTPESVSRDPKNKKQDAGRFPDVHTTHGSVDQLPLSSSVQAAGNQNTVLSPHHNISISHTGCQEEVGVNKEDKLLKVIEEQEEVIREKEHTIFTLKTLSSQLINHQETLHKGRGEEVKSKASTKNSQPPHVGEPDSGLGGDNAHSTISEGSVTHTRKVKGKGERDIDNDGRKEGGGGQENSTMCQQKERDYMVRILDLQTENEALHLEIARLQELVVNLEVQVTQTRRHMNQKDCCKSSHTLAQAGKRKKRASISTCPASNSSTESNTDSAYEEKTGSPLTSKTNSPYSDQPHPHAASSIPLQSLAKKQDRKYERGRNRGLKKDESSDTGSSRSQDHQPAQFTINPAQPLPKPEQQCSINPTHALQPSKPKPPQVVLPIGSDLVHKRAACIPNDAQVSNTRSLNMTPQMALSLPEIAAAETMNASKSWSAPDDVTFSSFSSVSDHHFHDGKVSLESSFLKGIRAPRHSRNTDVERSVFPISAGSSETPHFPLESTRVQDVSSHKAKSSSEGETMSIAVNTRNSTSVIETLD